MSETANYSSSVQAVQRFRYTLETPDNLTELDKTMTAVIHEWQRRHPTQSLCDDTIRVSVEDSTIVLWWEELTSG